MRCRLKVERGNRSSVAQVGCSPHLAPARFSRLPKTVYKYISSKRGEEANQIPGCCQVLSRLPPLLSTRRLDRCPLGSGPKGVVLEERWRGLWVDCLRTGNSVLGAKKPPSYLCRRRGRRCCIQHPGRVDSSHPDPARPAGGGLAQTRRDGGGKEEERGKAREKGSQREELSEGRGWGGTKGKGRNEEREGFRKEGRREQSGGRGGKASGLEGSNSGINMYFPQLESISGE